MPVVTPRGDEKGPAAILDQANEKLDQGLLVLGDVSVLHVEEGDAGTGGQYAQGRSYLFLAPRREFLGSVGGGVRVAVLAGGADEQVYVEVRPWRQSR